MNERGEFNVDGHWVPQDDFESVESNLSRSVLERWHLVNLMRPPGITLAYRYILSVIAEVCPPGNQLSKGRTRLAQNTGLSMRTIVEFYEWAYSAEVMERIPQKKKGLSDKVWPNYPKWIEYAVEAVKLIRDPKQREKEMKRLQAFGLALGKDLREPTSEVSSPVRVNS